VNNQLIKVSVYLKAKERYNEGIPNIIMNTSSDNNALIKATANGLVCEAGEFVIDPWEPAELALITHAHADHARPGSKRYIATPDSVALLQRRLGDNINIQAVNYNESIKLGNTSVSFHPAGHVLGSAQIRVEQADDVWVFTGDFKRDFDPTCLPFELVQCDTLITEATFALPVYRWQSGREVAAEIAHWWNLNIDANRPSVLFCYSLGKAQRVLAELMHFTDRSVFLHGAVAPLTQIYRDEGVSMLPTQQLDLKEKRNYNAELIIAPPGAAGTTWMRRFKGTSTGFCSGWMRVRGNRRRRGYDRGFVLSDHADWPALIQTIKECGASRILTTHGQSETLVRYLRELGYDASELTTQFTGDDAEPDATHQQAATVSSGKNKS